MPRDLRVGQALHDVHAVEQVQRLEARVDHLAERLGAAEHLCGGAGDLALAATSLAAHEQRAACGVGQDQRVDLGSAPPVTGAGEAVALDEIDRGIGAQRDEGVAGAHGGGTHRNGVRT
jgi:hypothetical protein